MKVVSFYRFLDIEDPAGLRDALQALCDELGLLGTILVASEGWNGTLAGSEQAVRTVFDWLRQRCAIAAELDARWTEAGEAPFGRMRVRLKKEIVALGRPDILPQRGTGTYVSPEEWNALLDDPNVVVIDTRNHYEHEVGTFPRAIDPGNDSFREFPAFAETLATTSKGRPLAMFCTGGIRCEKATALMLELGFDEVYHLQGGIIHYLETVAPEQNRWQGECFVFDKRVAIDRDLAEGGYVQCHACRRPLSVEEVASPDYVEGVSCPRCVAETEAERRAGLEERRRQIELAARRGEVHIGPKKTT